MSIQQIFKGRVWKFGDNIDTDIIIPARYLNITEASELSKFLFEPIRPNFSQQVEEGDIIIAGENFGCGSSREHAPIAIKASGIACIVAKSFARIFYRNSFNIGLLLIICPEVVDETCEKEEINIELQQNKIYNQTKHKWFSFPRFEWFMMKLIEHGGLIPFILSEEYKQ